MASHLCLFLIGTGKSHVGYISECWDSALGVSLASGHTTKCIHKALDVTRWKSGKEQKDNFTQSWKFRTTNYSIRNYVNIKNDNPVTRSLYQFKFHLNLDINLKNDFSNQRYMYMPQLSILLNRVQFGKTEVNRTNTKRNSCYLWMWILRRTMGLVSHYILSQSSDLTPKWSYWIKTYFQRWKIKCSVSDTGMGEVVAV